MYLFLDCGKATHVGKTMSDFKRRVAVGECICNSMKVLQDKTVLVKIVQVNTGLIANTNTTYYEAFLLALNQVTCLLCPYPSTATGSS